MQQAEVFLAPVGSARLKDLDKTDLDYNTQAVKEAVYWARYEGDRILIDGNTVWLGLLPGSGEDRTLEDTWNRDGERLLRMLEDLPRGTLIEVKTYRPGGSPRWALLKSFTLR